MQHSSRRNPCPICSRDKDDKCRWNDEFILCYAGNSFSPPTHLRLGEKIKVGANSYALCSQVSGFAGNSFCFALVDDFDYRFLSYEDKISYRRQCVKVTRLFLRKQSTALGAVHGAYDIDDFDVMTIDQFYANKRNVKTAIALLADLIEYAAINKRHLVDYINQIRQITEAVKSARELLEGVHQFERRFLGSPSPEQSDMRGLQVLQEGASAGASVSSIHGILQGPASASRGLQLFIGNYK